MESLSLYISMKQCLLLSNIAMPVALYVSIAMLATFFVERNEFQETFREICHNRNTVYHEVTFTGHLLPHYWRSRPHHR